MHRWANNLDQTLLAGEVVYLCETSIENDLKPLLPPPLTVGRPHCDVFFLHPCDVYNGPALSDCGAGCRLLLHADIYKQVGIVRSSIRVLMEGVPEV